MSTKFWRGTEQRQIHRNQLNCRRPEGVRRKGPIPDQRAPAEQRRLMVDRRMNEDYRSWLGHRRATIVTSSSAPLPRYAQFLMFRREIVRRGRVEIDLQSRQKQIALISQLADSLHSSNSRDESYEVIQAFAGEILAGTSGCLYVYSYSRDQLNRAAQWGLDAVNPGQVDHFTPDECWGLRRGKTNVMSSVSGHVHCRHVRTETPLSYLCLPIAGRGQTSGLLYLQSSDPRGEAAFAPVMMPARSFADQLSLALVNIELRERLQNMAIKDPSWLPTGRRICP